MHHREVPVATDGPTEWLGSPPSLKVHGCSFVHAYNLTDSHLLLQIVVEPLLDNLAIQLVAVLLEQLRL